MKIDFNNIVYLEIGGEIGKNNSLSLVYFAELAKNFQKLIDKIVENDLSTDDAIDKKNFKIELSDFKSGSAVPGFRFTKDIHMIVGPDPNEQRKQVSEKFDSLIQLADKGNYLQLKKLYPDFRRRNEIVNSLYDFVDCLKTPQASFVHLKGKKIIPIYKIRKFRKSTRDSLIVKVKDSEQEGPQFTYGKVKITKTNGKERKTLQDVYNPESTSISHVFELIKTEDKIYQLASPLMCILEKDKNGFIIDSPILGVVGGGETRNDAVNDFCLEFEYLYNKLQKLDDKKLSKKMRNSKAFFNILIESIV